MITAQTEYNHNHILDLSDATCKYSVISTFGESLIKDPEKLRVIVLLIDGNTGNVVNAASSAHSGMTDNSRTEEIPEKSEVLSTEYFSLDGRHIYPQPGSRVVIVVLHMSDGTTQTEKRIL